MNPVPLDIIGTSGVRLRLWDYGGDGPLLLLIHCAGTMGRIWEPVIARLSLKARILALDLRGHGDSDKPRGAEEYHWTSFAEDVLAVVDAMAPASWLGAIGHSGGAVALTIAQLERNGCFPKWMLVDAILAQSLFFPATSPLAKGARRRKQHFSDIGEAEKRLAVKYPYNQWKPEAFRAFLNHGFDHHGKKSVILKCPGEIEAYFYEAGSTETILNQLPSAPASLLLVTGSNSYMLDWVKMQHTLAPAGAALRIIPDVGHFIPQEAPENLAALIDSWFTDSDQIPEF